MKAGNAAGRKTDRFTSAMQRYEDQMEKQLTLLTDAMRGSVARADLTTDADDEYGHRRDSHISQAVKIGAVSAQIVLALGKLGGEFNHNINVKRVGENAPANHNSGSEAPDGSWLKHAISGKRLPLDVALPPSEVGRSSSHPPLDRALKQWHAERDALDAEEEAARRTEGDTSPESRGSNG